MIFACLYICVVIFIGHPPGRYGHHEFLTPPRTCPHNRSPVDPMSVSNLCHCTRPPCRTWSPELGSGRHRVLSPRVVVQQMWKTRWKPMLSCPSRRTFIRSESSSSSRFAESGMVSWMTAIRAIVAMTRTQIPEWRPVSSGCQMRRDTRARITRGIVSRRVTNAMRLWARSPRRVTGSRVTSSQSRSRELVPRAGAACRRPATASRRARRARCCDWSIRPEPCPLPILSIGPTIKEPRYVPRRQLRPSGRFHSSASFQFRGSFMGDELEEASLFLSFLRFPWRLCLAVFPTLKSSRRFYASQYLALSWMINTLSAARTCIGRRYPERRYFREYLRQYVWLANVMLH